MVDREKALAILAFLRKQNSDDIELLADVMGLKPEFYDDNDKRILGITIAMGTAQAIPQNEWQAMQDEIWLKCQEGAK